MGGLIGCARSWPVKDMGCEEKLLLCDVGEVVAVAVARSDVKTSILVGGLLVSSIDTHLVLVASERKFSWWCSPKSELGLELADKLIDKFWDDDCLTGESGELLEIENGVSLVMRVRS